MAVFKVLGFQPKFIMSTVIREAMLVGAVGECWEERWPGLSSVSLPFKLPVLLQLSVTAEAIPIGLVLGCWSAFWGSIIPAWNVRNTNVTEVFSKIA